MSLMLHVGAAALAYDDLRSVVMPPATETHVPVAHHEVVELVRYALGFYGHEIVEEAHAITQDGARYFGLMSLRSPYGEYTDTVGLRNSHDKTFPIGLAFGSKVFVCDNLAFVGDHVIRRKHTQSKEGAAVALGGNHCSSQRATHRAKPKAPRLSGDTAE
jgi:hypothetical protein